MKPIILLSAAIAAAVLTACAPAQVKLPAEFAQSAVVHPVDGHSPRRFNEPIFIGPYSARQLQDGDTFQWEGGLGRRTSTLDSERAYAFAITTPGEPPVQVQCFSRQSLLRHGDEDSMLEIDLTGLEGSLLSCDLRLGDAGPVLPLELVARGNRLEGSLASPWGGLTLRSLHGFDGSIVTAMDASGFEVLHEGRTWMVVETINAGRVLFDPSTDGRQRAYLAAAATALLMLDADLGD